MIRSWENLVTDRRTDRRTDKSDFIGRCPTNVERQKNRLTKATTGIAPEKCLQNICKTPCFLKLKEIIEKFSQTNFDRITISCSNKNLFQQRD